MTPPTYSDEETLEILRCEIADAEAHNAWIDELKEDIDFEPLRDFLDRLKEPTTTQPQRGEP